MWHVYAHSIFFLFFFWLCEKSRNSCLLPARVSIVERYDLLKKLRVLFCGLKYLL